MGTPFNLIFNPSDKSRYIIKTFADSRNELFKNDHRYIIDFKENRDLTFLFYSEDDYILHIDLFDSLPLEYFTDQEKKLAKSYNKLFIKPSKNERTIYKNIAKIELPRLIPGSYIITIRNTNENYYAFLNISPLRVNTKQLDIMRKDIDDFLLGLSKEYKPYISSANIPGNISEILYYTNLFIKYNREITNSIQRIINNPKSQINKSYKLKPRFFGGRTDKKSIKYIEKNSDERVLIYKNYSNFNVEPNNSLKYIAHYFINKLNKSANYLSIAIASLHKQHKEAIKYRHSYLHLKELIQQKENLIIINQLNNLIKRLLSANWMNSVEYPKFYKSNIKMLRTTPYNVLHNIYTEFIDDLSLKNNPLNNFLYYWKDTSLLYEIWGFINVIKTINNLKHDFKPISGWVFDYNIDKNTILPFLESHTTIVFENNQGLILKVYYDSFLAKHSDETSIDNPVFNLEKKRRPDLRIDVYENGLYLKSIIGDFKYRPYDVFSTYDKNNDVYTQLKCYSYSRSMFLKSNNKRTRAEESVIETWIIYPELEDSKIERRNTWDMSARIRKIEMSPKRSLEPFQNLLEETIEDIIIER